MERAPSGSPGDLLPLHPVEFRILLALLGGPAHGYQVVKQVEASGTEGARLFPANLYRRIRDLRARGLLEEVAPPREGDDPRRRYLAVTPLGRAVARAEAARMEALLAEARDHGLLPA